MAPKSKYKPKFKATLSLRLPSALRRRLDQLASSEGNPINAVVRRLLTDGVSRASAEAGGDQ